MVSKSANYCMGTSTTPTIVLTLCDVALGSQYERITAEFEAAERTKAAKKDSCWGIGKTAPDPAATRALASGAKVPLGQGGPNQYLADNLERLKAAENTRAAALMSATRPRPPAAPFGPRLPYCPIRTSPAFLRAGTTSSSCTTRRRSR